MKNLYAIRWDIRKIGTMAATGLEDDLPDGVETVDKVHVKAWIDSDPVISIEAIGEKAGDTVITEDRKVILMREELAKKAEAAGIDAELWKGMMILNSISCKEGWERKREGAASEWAELYLVMGKIWGGWDNARPYRTLEEAKRYACGSEIRKASCRFDDDGKCTVVEWED